MLKVVSPGLLTTVQDGGRTGYQSRGVPVCGAMDRYALFAANILVGNDMNEPALEITALGPTLEFESANIFALAGGRFAAALDGAPLKPGRAYAAARGSVLTVGAAEEGFRAYVAVAGGLDAERVMGSAATCIAAGFGGYMGRALQTGDRIGMKAPRAWMSGMTRRETKLRYSAEPDIRVIMGPQDGMFSQRGKDIFLGSEYRLSGDCDRMGYRLDGRDIEYSPGNDGNIVSDGVAMGSVQVPSGKPIIMMADRQTIGGYAKIACVISADLPLLAQKRPGDSIRFREVSVMQAQESWRRMMRGLRALEEDIAAEDIW
ncbi:MAG: biotin-dependent carboxyltransferase family protein [Clostridia bacterium]|nr:biotin-dependent carboxyltransferase family protein [Clostridia bacterium]